MAIKRKGKAARARSAAKATTKRKLKLVVTEQASAAEPKQKTATKTRTSGRAKASSSAGSSNISRKLLEALEKRQKKSGPRVLAKPPGRRGRRPKRGADYVPSTNEEEYGGAESEFERIEYDTGIKVSYAVDQDVPVYERSDDFEEELNFDG